MTKSRHAPKLKPSLLDVLMSVLASFFGVQSHTNYERDFKQSSVVPFIIVGIVMVVVLVVGLVLMVNIITQ